MTAGATARLAAFAARTTYDDLPADVRRITADLLRDSIGCAIAGRLVEKGSIAIDVAESMGGHPEASVLGTAHRTSPAVASFANGELINALDYDAILAPGHVTPYVIPPALALAEAKHRSGRELILAVALGHEIGCRVAAALDGLRRLVGSPPKVRYTLSNASGYGSTIFGAVAGAGAILRFDERAMANAFGLAGYAAPVPSLTKYLKAKKSFHAKYTSAGVVAMQATVAAMLAQRGYEGDDTVLDGPSGFWRMYASSRCNWDFMLGGLGQEWYVLRAEPKAFPAFRMSHAALDALRNLLATERIDPDEIRGITVHADPVSMNACYLNTRIQNHTDAQLSWPYLIAAAAYYEPGVAWQREALKDARVTRLMERVRVVASDRWADQLIEESTRDTSTREFPIWLRSEVQVEVGDRKYVGRIPGHSKGHPTNPMRPEEFERKFVANVSAVSDRGTAERIWSALERLEDVADVSSLVRTFSEAA